MFQSAGFQDQSTHHLSTLAHLFLFVYTNLNIFVNFSVHKWEICYQESNRWLQSYIFFKISTLWVIALTHTYDRFKLFICIYQRLCLDLNQGCQPKGKHMTIAASRNKPDSPTQASSFKTNTSRGSTATRK